MKKAKECGLRKCQVNHLAVVGIKKAVSAGQTSLSEAFSTKRLRDITNAITTYLDMDPFQTVKRKGFKDYIQALDPRSVVPGSKHFSQSAGVMEVKTLVCITTDHGTNIVKGVALKD